MTIAIIGAQGFIGRHVVSHLLAHGVGRLVLLSRHPPSTTAAAGVPGTVWRRADLTDEIALTDALVDADVIVNLAWPGEAADPEVWCGALAGAVLAREGRHLVHCSTAVVAGRTRARVVVESTPPHPVTPYERQKLRAEEVLTTRLGGRAPLTVARPTAVFGPGGRNLLALADALRRDDVARATVRRMLFGDRAMHLVPVETVAEALHMLATHAPPTEPVTLHVAADDDPENTYRCVERRLAAGLGLAQTGWPPFTLPSAVLSLALRARRRSDTSAHRHYSGEALRAAGFVTTCAVGPAVERYGQWLASGGRVP
jgi:nucleoside-diphosphate-sugar epimerase